MDKRAVLNSLDQAIAEAVQAECDKLTPGWTLSERKDHIGWVSNHIREALRKLTSPNYQWPLAPPVYAGIYQWSHVNIAYSMIKKMVTLSNPQNDILTDSSKLHVMDFGCGAFAMSFGLALALTEAIESGQKVTEVRIDAIDNSTFMMDMGQTIWDTFVKNVSRNANLASTRKACALIDSQTHTSVETVPRATDKNCWVSALHTIYRDNQSLSEVKRSLANLYQKGNPIVVGPEV